MVNLKFLIVISFLTYSHQNEFLSCVKNNDVCSKGLKVIKPIMKLPCNCSLPSFTNLLNAKEEKWKFICSTVRSISFKVNRNKTNFGSLVSYNTLDSQRQFLVLTNETYLSVNGLHPDTSYNFDFIEIGQDNNFVSFQNLVVSTFAYTEVPDRASNLSILEWESGGKFVNVRMEWLPGNRSTCHFDFFWHTQLSMNVKEIRNVEDLYTISIKNLMYDHNYTIIIISVCDELEFESEKYTHILRTPPCSTISKKLSSLFCLPEKLVDVNVKENLVLNSENGTAFYDVIVQWSIPQIIPKLVYIQLENYGFQDDQLNERKVHGNVTSTKFLNINLGHSYKIKIWAESSAGVGPPVQVYREMDTDLNVKVSSFSRMEILMFLTITLIIASIIIIVTFYKIQKKKKIDRIKDDAHNVEDLSYLNENSEYFADIFEVPRSSITFCGVLGEGAFGLVKKGLLSHNGNNLEVAVKTLKEKHSEEDKEQLVREIKMLQAIGQHNHVVSMIACVTKCAVENMLLVVEFCANGDLLNYLHSVKVLLLSKRKNAIYENENREFLRGAVANKLYEAFPESNHNFEQFKTSENAVRDLVSFAKQVADGMEFLSGNRIIHRDLAARNVLVTSEYILKISDFGLSRDIYQNNCYMKTSHGKVPIKWMAIESLLSQKYTTQSDVWSFGVLMWEIMTYGNTPYVDESPSRLIDFLCSGGRLSRPENTSPALYAIMLSCWNFKSCDRPRFSHLKDALDDILLNDDFLKHNQ